MTRGGDVRIERIRVSELPDFAAQASRDGGVVPLSKVRAAAQARNPHARPDDIGLLVAYTGQVRVGYLGLLPGLVRVDGASHPMSWLSMWYVAPEHRRLAPGVKLMLQAMRLGRDVAVTGFAPATAGIYAGLRWKALGPLRFPVLRLNRINALAAPLLMLRRRLGRGGAGRPLVDRALSVAQAPIRRTFYQLALGSLRASLEAITVRPLARVDDAAFERDEDRLAPVRFFRGASTINWMLENPWTGPGRADDQTGTLRGFLGHPATTPLGKAQLRQPATPGSCFRHVAVDLQRARDGRSLGFLVMAIADRGEARSLAVLDDQVHDPQDKVHALAATLQLAARHGADIVSVPPAWRPAIARSTLLSATFAEGELGYFRWGDMLAPHVPRLRLALSDGDLPWT